MTQQLSDEFKGDLNIQPINSHSIKRSTKVANDNNGNTVKKEIKTKEVTKETITEDDIINKDVQKWFHEMVVEEAVEGILNPSDTSDIESVKDEPPKEEIKIIKKIDPIKKEEKKVTPKKNNNNNNNNKEKHTETPDEMEKRLLHELLLEMNEGEVIGVLDPSSSPQGSRTQSKASGKK